jgi:hypothetical protein
MECKVIEKYLKENDFIDHVVPGNIQKHLVECKDCQHYYQFVLALDLQKGELEKAPAEILLNIEKKIFDSVKPLITDSRPIRIKRRINAE